MSEAKSVGLPDNARTGREVELGQRLAPEPFGSAQGERTGREVELGPRVYAGMVFIPAGEFVMGSNDYDSEKPQRLVYLDDYWIDQYPVTVARYREFCNVTGRSMPEAPGWGWKDDHPIVKVSWDDATAYCQWASETSGFRVRLPTEAEWEKAARGVDGRKYPWGNEWDASKCNNYTTGPKQTTPVGSYSAGASPYGVNDMAGNVWEWCADWYDGNYYRNAPARNPAGPASGTYRVVRGGSWSNLGTLYFRAANRTNGNPADRNGYTGFRGAQSP